MSIESGDIQAIILRGYPRLRAARFYLLTIKDASAARDWLRGVAGRVVPFEQKAQIEAVHLAFTHSGLSALGLPQQTLDSFSREFREGMTAPHRRRSLGDHGINSPQGWQWGGGASAHRVDLLLMLYAKDEAQLSTLEHALLLSRLSEQGLERVGTLESEALPNSKEHFGFRDGVSQPAIRELSEPCETDDARQVRIGEFVLGYKNEYGEYPHSPTLPPESAGYSASTSLQDRLSSHPIQSEQLDFGRNGSYLVFRQIEQNVAAFWRYINRAADTVHHPLADVDEVLKRHWLAAKMVGRWMDGAPLVHCPYQPPSDEDPAKTTLGRANDFSYHKKDPHGYLCPLGAHIRRTHPRDALEPGPGTGRSWDVNRRHRIMRRGRAYGKPLVGDFDLDALLKAEDDGESRGLHFLCFNANIARQFEFIQQSWVNNKKFAELYNDADPLIGDHDPREEGGDGQFTIQQSPVRQRVTGLGTLGAGHFTRVVGGAYFFMPGIHALQVLVNM